MRSGKRVYSPKNCSCVESSHPLAGYSLWIPQKCFVRVWKNVPVVQAWGRGTTDVCRKGMKPTTPDSENKNLNIGGKEGGQTCYNLMPYCNPLQLEK